MAMRQFHGYYTLDNNKLFMIYFQLFNITNRSYSAVTRAFYEKVFFYKVTGFKPDLNEAFDMLKKSNKSEVQFRSLLPFVNNYYSKLLQQHINIIILVYYYATYQSFHAQPITSLYIGKYYLYVKQIDEAKKWLEATTKSKCLQTEGAVHTYVSLTYFLY